MPPVGLGVGLPGIQNVKDEGIFRPAVPAFSVQHGQRLLDVDLVALAGNQDSLAQLGHLLLDALNGLQDHFIRLIGVGHAQGAVELVGEELVLLVRLVPALQEECINSLKRV